PRIPPPRPPPPPPPNPPHPQPPPPPPPATPAPPPAHRRHQPAERLATGPTWPDTDLVFTHPDGTPLHPAHATTHFHHLTATAGLPPIRLHDLRHGAATLALAAGINLKTVQAMLRHSSITITAHTYTRVLPQVPHHAATIIETRINPTRADRQPTSWPKHDKDDDGGTRHDRPPS